jgi:hypothetical protein
MTLETPARSRVDPGQLAETWQLSVFDAPVTSCTSTLLAVPPPLNDWIPLPSPLK